MPIQNANKIYPLIPENPARRLQVIGAGLPRTGTSSLCRAIELLCDGPACHAGSIVLKREEGYIKKWISILNPSTKVASDNLFGYIFLGFLSLFDKSSKRTPEEVKTEDVLKDLLDGYVVTADAASIFFVGELAEAYPEAKVICTVRDPPKWFSSYTSLVKSHTSLWQNLATFVRPTNRLYVSWMSGIVERRKHIYPQNRDDPLKIGPDFMAIHEQYLRRVVPQERLFFYDIKDGWEPLCVILNVPVPDIPFPHAYDAVEMSAGHAELRRKGMQEWFRICTLPVAASWKLIKVVLGLP